MTLKTPEPGSPFPLPQAAILPSLDDLESDARHIVEMVGIANEHIGHIFTDEPLSRSDRDRHSAVLWVTLDLVERLAKQIQALSESQVMQKANRANRGI